MVNSTLSILKLQYKQIRFSTLYFWILLATFLISVVVFYPGRNDLLDLMDVLTSPSFQFFLGSLPEDTNFYYGLWLQMWVVSMFPLFMIGFGLYLGVEATTREQADKTFDLGFILPKHRLSILSFRILGSLFYIIITLLISIIITYLGVSFANENMEIDIIIFIWIAMGIQTLAGLAIGVFIGAILFDRGIAFQISFVLVILALFLSFIINVSPIFLKDPIVIGLSSINFELVINNNTILDILKFFSIINYLDAEEIIFNNNFTLDPFYPLFFVILLLFIASFVIFRNRDLNETEYRPLWVYFSPIYWKNRKSKAKISKRSVKSRFSMSRILVSWSPLIRRRFPIIADELWAHGTFLLVYVISLFLLIFGHLIIYPGDEGAVNLLLMFKFTPFYLLISRGVDLESVPYLAYLVSMFFSYIWILFIIYAVYRIYKIELRDSGKSDEFIWIRPMSQNKVYLHRLAALVIEYYIVLIASSLWILIAEIILGQTQFSITEILVMLLSGPVYFSIAMFISVLIAYFPKYGKKFGTFIVLIIILGYVFGTINKGIEWIAQLTPMYYFDSVDLIYNGIKVEDLVIFILFVLLNIFFLLIRLRKKDRYLETY